MPLHPQAQEFLDEIAASEKPSWDTLDPTESRELFAQQVEMFGAGADMHLVSNRITENGVPIRIYYPSDSDLLPVCMYFHGGGFVLGNLETHDSLCRNLAHESGCVVVAVDYRLAPENRYPSALDDCYEATEFVVSHASELNVDANRVVVAGDSAGGNLAATVSLRARDRTGAAHEVAVPAPTIRGQVLIYPVIENDFSTDSYTDYAEGFGLSRDVMKWFWAQYLGEQTADSFAAPIQSQSLSELPSAHILTAEYDVLRSEGERYSLALSDAGVPTTLRQYDGMLHGFVHFSGLFETGKMATADLGKVIREFAS